MTVADITFTYWVDIRIRTALWEETCRCYGKWEVISSIIGGEKKVMGPFCSSHHAHSVADFTNITAAAADTDAQFLPKEIKMQIISSPLPPRRRRSHKFMWRHSNVLPSPRKWTCEHDEMWITTRLRRTYMQLQQQLRGKRKSTINTSIGGCVTVGFGIWATERSSRWWSKRRQCRKQCLTTDKKGGRGQGK